MVFCLTRRRWVLLGVSCFLLLCLIFAPQFVFANLSEGITTVVNAVVGGLMKGLEWILGLFQFLFLQVIEFTILDFAKNWNEGGFLSDFRVVWQVLRDFVNLIIVVLFILTAMMTAFGEAQFGFHRKSLVYLIGAAILVNFSAFFTLLVIDISHILFMLFFNALDASSWGSFSPFSGYTEILGDVGTGMFNLIIGVIAIVVNWFILLGILYFCIILIERYIIAMFLVLLSPLAALGFFASISGGNPLTARFVGVYTQWKEKLGYVFTMPVVLILGFTLLLVLFRGALGQTADPTNFVKLIGVGTSEGRGILLQIIMASIVLIIGIFKVGAVAKQANIHSAIAGKFKFGEIASKLVGPKSQLGILQSFKNPASRGIGNYKQKIYNKQDQWRKEGSPLAKIPGIGKPLDIGGKARRTKQAAQTVVRGVDAVAGGRSARDVAWQSAEVKEDKRILDVIHTGTFEQKENLLKQALDSKSNVTLTEQQTALLARNDKLHPLLSSLGKGVSQSTFRQIYKDTETKAEEVALRQESITTEKDAFSDDYKAKQQALQVASADFKNAEDSYGDLMQQKNLAQKEYGVEKKDVQAEYDVAKDLFKQTDMYKAFEQDLNDKQQVLEKVESSGDAQAVEAMRKNIKNFEEDFYKTTATADPVGLALREKFVTLEDLSDPQSSKSPTAAVLREVEDSLRKAGEEKRGADSRQKKADEVFTSVESAHRVAVRKKEGENTEDRRKIGQIFSNLAANTATGVSVGGDAAAVFNPDALTDVRNERKSMTADTQEMFSSMKNDYAQSSVVVSEALTAEQESLVEKDTEDNVDLIKKKSAYYQEQAQNPDLDVLTPSMERLQKEIDVLEQAATDRHTRSLEIDKKKERIDAIRKSFEGKDISDAKKLEILGQSASSAASFMQDGTQYLGDQLQFVTDKIDAFEQNAQASGIDLNTSDAYKDLQDEQGQIEERLQSISGIGENIESVRDSLDAQEAIINSPAYKEVFDREQYLNMFSVNTLLRDITSAMDKQKEKFEDGYRAKQKDKKDSPKNPPKNAYKQDSEWKSLDQWRKNIERIKKEGGASAELQQQAIKAVNQSAKAVNQSARNRGTRS